MDHSIEGAEFSAASRASCVFITAVPLIKLFAWGEGESGGHVLREVPFNCSCRNKNSSKAIYPLGAFHQKEKTNTCDDAITMTLMVQW
jgi:hypothetical protein